MYFGRMGLDCDEVSSWFNRRPNPEEPNYTNDPGAVMHETEYFKIEEVYNQKFGVAKVKNGSSKSSGEKITSFT